MDETPTAPAPEMPDQVSTAPVRRGARGTRLWWVLVPVLVLMVAGTIAGAVVRAPYVSFAPGSARSTAPLLSVPGQKIYRDRGDVLFTTVSVAHPTYLEALWGWIRSDTDVFPEDVIQGDQSDDETRKQNLQLMDESKLIAAKVALEKLGYEVGVKGTGALIVDVQQDLPVAGVLHTGDTVISADGKKIGIDTDLIAVIGSHRPGDRISLTVEPVDSSGRRLATKSVRARLASRPEAPDEAMLGVGIRTRNINYQFPFTVKIDSENVGGPSAGLAWTLAVLDRLTPGSLTGGRKVAVTGEIAPGGQVNEVGGVAQKTVAAQDEGADLFIVPTGEYDEALARAEGMRVAKVDTLDDALKLLADLGGNALELGTPGASPGA